MADITRTFTLEEAATILIVGYGSNATETNLEYVIDDVVKTEPIFFSPAQAIGSQMMIYGITTLTAGEHTVVVRGTSNDITTGWLWILVGENTNQNTIGVND